jgi:hypothetical protein
MKSNKYYANRLYKQAIAAPSVNPLEEGEIEAYIREEAAKLCLNSDAIVEEAKRLHPEPTTQIFKKATYYETLV